MPGIANPEDFNSFNKPEAHVWTDPSKLAAHILAERGDSSVTKDDQTIRYRTEWDDPVVVQAYTLESARLPSNKRPTYYLTVIRPDERIRYGFNWSKSGVYVVDDITNPNDIKKETINSVGMRYSQLNTDVLNFLQTAPLINEIRVGDSRSAAKQKARYARRELREKISALAGALAFNSLTHTLVVSDLEEAGVLAAVDVDRDAVEYNPARINKLIGIFIRNHPIYTDALVRQAISARDKLRRSQHDSVALVQRSR
jgi:hypothetical protein